MASKFIKLSRKEQLEKYGFVLISDMTMEEILALPRASVTFNKIETKTGVVFYEAKIAFNESLTSRLQLEANDLNVVKLKFKIKEDSFKVNLPVRVYKRFDADGQVYYTYQIVLAANENHRHYKKGVFKNAEAIIVEETGLQVQETKAYQNDFDVDDDAATEVAFN